MSEDPFYKTCSRKMLLHDHECKGRITWEHVLIYAGKQIQEKWAIIPLCEYTHSVNQFQDCGILNKTKNKWISLNRATNEELHNFSKSINYDSEKKTLNALYGEPDFSYIKDFQS